MQLAHLFLCGATATFGCDFPSKQAFQNTSDAFENQEVPKTKKVCSDRVRDPNKKRWVTVRYIPSQIRRGFILSRLSQKLERAEIGQKRFKNTN